MPAITSYSEPQLAAFVLGNGCLGATAAALSWVGQSDIQDAIDLALTAYGVATINLATDAAKLRAAVTVEAWRLVVNATAGYYRVSLDGQSMDRQMVHAHAVAMLAMAEQVAGSLGVGSGTVHIDRLESPGPYTYQTDEALARFF